MTISYSALAAQEACQQFWHATYVARTQEKSSQKSIRGVAAHDSIEQSVKDFVRFERPVTGFVGDVLHTLTEQTGSRAFMAEMWSAVKQDLTASKYGEVAWLRSKIDLVHFTSDGAVATVVDWKTGNYMPTKSSFDDTQLIIDAITLFGRPKIREVKAVFAYTKFEKILPSPPVHLTRDDVLGDKKEWRVIKIFDRLARYELNAAKPKEELTATPGPKCNFCPVAECPYNPGH